MKIPASVRPPTVPSLVVLNGSAATEEKGVNPMNTAITNSWINPITRHLISTPPLSLLTMTSTSLFIVFIIIPPIYNYKLIQAGCPFIRACHRLPPFRTRLGLDDLCRSSQELSQNNDRRCQVSWMSEMEVKFLKN